MVDEPACPRCSARLGVPETVTDSVRADATRRVEAGHVLKAVVLLRAHGVELSKAKDLAFHFAHCHKPPGCACKDGS